MTLVDTPGFDDTYKTDTEILQSIVEWLTTTYKEGTRLSGILYLHRITDVRMQGSAMRNLRVFRELCGKDCFKNVALCATFWDAAEEDESILNERLRELKENEEFWGGMLACGSRVFKEPLTRKQAFNLIYQLTEKEAVTLQVQKEVVDEQKSLSDCSAFAAFMNLELDRQRQEHEVMMTEAKRQFHEELQRRDRTLSEDLAGMKKIFEDKLAIMETTNAQLRAEIESKNQRPESVPVIRRPVVPVSQKERPQSDGVQPQKVQPQNIQQEQRIPLQPTQHVEQHRLSTASSNTHPTSPGFVEPVVQFPFQEKPPLQNVKTQIIRPIQSQNPLHPDLTRIHTTPADYHSLFIEFVNRRHQRYTAFVQYMTARIQLIESEKRQGRVKCHLLERKSCYLMVCTNCLRNVGGGEFYSELNSLCLPTEGIGKLTQRHRMPALQCRARFRALRPMLLKSQRVVQCQVSQQAGDAPGEVRTQSKHHHPSPYFTQSNC